MDSDMIRTYSGVRFSPMTAEPDDIVIGDIAHALSLMTRANGHFESFFSVAQHSINCMAEAEARGMSRRVCFACLLHDASEAYISDITRPVKQHLTKYEVIEKRLQGVIYSSLGVSELSACDEEAVRSVDDAMLYYEFLHFTGERVFEHEPLLLSSPDFSFRPFKDVENEFLGRYNAYRNL